MSKERLKGRSCMGFPRNYIVLDIETTGLSPTDDEIIEIGAIKYRNNKEIDRFQTLVKPSCHISSFISDLTGITDEMVEDAPDIKEVLEKLLKFVGKQKIVGYNVNFDVNFIYDKCEEELGYIFNNDFIDVMRYAKNLYPEMAHHRLKDMVELFGIKVEGAHRAIYDCLSTNACYKEMEKVVKGE